MSDSSFINPLNQIPTDILTSTGTRFESKVRSVRNASGTAEKNELKTVAQEFEAIFIAHMLKVMRATIEESGLMEGGFGKSIYTEMFDQEVALDMARHGALGISDLLTKSLSENDASKGKIPGEVPERDSDPRNQNPRVFPGNPESSPDADREITDMQLPIAAPISSSFGIRRDPFTHKAKFHKGVDFAAPEGLKVLTALPGKVIAAKYENGYGNTVLVQHDGGFQTRYSHLGSVYVKAGDVVASDSILGTVGSTGRSTGPHLHFEVIRMGRPVDPILNAGFRAPTPELTSVKP